MASLALVLSPPSIVGFVSVPPGPPARLASTARMGAHTQPSGCAAAGSSWGPCKWARPIHTTSGNESSGERTAEGDEPTPYASPFPRLRSRLGPLPPDHLHLRPYGADEAQPSPLRPEMKRKEKTRGGGKRQGPARSRQAERACDGT
ncbi:hypothetical protein CDD83_5817 [Cordyceps sp. RAO-2017]|nr:hypothetical protein CDD83_5817 [Cordyceps sp. RAO-2017]